MKKNRTDSVWVAGHTPLTGYVSTQGSKNAALPIISAIPLLPEVELYNVPDLSDIHVMVDILKELGGKGEFSNGVLKFHNKHLENTPIKEEYASKLRASSLFMGSLLGRFKEATVGLPGGCVIGSRQLDIHYKGFETLGTEVSMEHGSVHLKTNGLEGHFALSFPSVGATQNLISASVLGEGEVTLHNVAMEPEVIDMIHFLNMAGANIQYIQPATLRIVGVDGLRPVRYKVQPDRIEAMTLLIAGIATKGEVTVTHCQPSHFAYPLQVLSEMGAKVETGSDYITAGYQGPLKGTTIKTDVYPGFPTDMQSQLSVLMTQCSDVSVLTEDIFNNRFRHLEELERMNATIKMEGNTAFIHPSTLSGCRVDSFDLRGAASMIIAGMCADGLTSVHSLKYLYRGYEDFIGKLNYLGAEITYR